MRAYARPWVLAARDDDDLLARFSLTDAGGRKAATDRLPRRTHHGARPPRRGSRCGTPSGSSRRAARPSGLGRPRTPIASHSSTTTPSCYPVGTSTGWIDEREWFRNRLLTTCEAQCRLLRSTATSREPSASPSTSSPPSRYGTRRVGRAAVPGHHWSDRDAPDLTYRDVRQDLATTTRWLAQR